MRHYDAIVIGAGSMGMAAGYYLARQGVKTLLLDSGDPPHQWGSHHGDTRIIRYAYGEGRQYVPLALRAKELWAELAEETGKRLFVQTGVLSAGPADAPFLREVQESAAQYSLPLEVLDAGNVGQRWPGIRLPAEFLGCFEPTAGVLYSEECIRAYRNRALAAGAELRTGERVTGIQAKSDSVSVQTQTDTYSGSALLISAGAWSAGLLVSLGLSLPLTPTRKTVSWFAADEQLYSSDRFPAFLFTLADSMFYGFPSLDGAGVKIGRHDGGQPADPDQLDRTFGLYPSDEADTRSFLERYMPQAAGPLRQGKVCLYTYTPDEHFIIDRHPEYPHIVIAAGFSGHGFKFASAVGEAASQLITRGTSEIDLSLFRVTRF
ncbi:MULTISPECIES: N-methyl-L-tryptophan oxidase [Bacillales]|uniref:N-methyl-L-tryptophan oxidase n=1 Tax=Brevibacillus TaxID=55080 RepID=UPI000E39A8D4|nr:MULTISPECIES: N-methyl-L-tryptophan oxidase [Bacillales]MDT3416439.1 sarcosine oxidase/N-methyl-L-tryptophan oxidase [Brevibacillus aydinogluensis]NNV02319.1 N-methyl-L-tryptophan oxidase [Brevibacillus sp. MCWH]REK66828.1 MAG: N-methyl-L-tryptophan oxidase [Brevibacillus sp.]UFJ62762.1 N-methyl-L-tryptophan oxidase [Anoxybacillus sediminis]